MPGSPRSAFAIWVAIWAAPVMHLRRAHERCRSSMARPDQRGIQRGIVPLKPAGSRGGDRMTRGERVTVPLLAGLLVVAACTRPSEQRALAELEVGSAGLDGIAVQATGGLAAI